MKIMFNPYYNEIDGIEKIVFNEDGLCYEYDMIIYLAKDGKVYVASDQGCSCPIPFDGYEAPTVERMLDGMERVGSINQGMAIFDSWNYTDYGKYSKVSINKRNDLRNWLEKNFKE